MTWWGYVGILFVIGSIGLTPAFAQVEVNVTTSGDPCFLNYTATGIEVWQNCGVDEDFISAFLLPFEWVTGGLFTILIVSVLIIMTYMKYKTAIYPLAIGIIMLPLSYFAFPEEFVIFAAVLAALTFGTYIWYAYVRQTKEY